MGRQTKKQPTGIASAISSLSNPEGSHQLPGFLSQCPKHPFLPLTEINLNETDNAIQCQKCSVGQDKLYIYEILHSPDDFILTNWPQMDSINKELQQALQKPTEAALIQEKKKSNNMKNSTRNQDKMRDLFTNLREKILQTLDDKEKECLKLAAALDSPNKIEEQQEFFRKSTIDLYLKLSQKYELKEVILKPNQSLQNLQNSIKKILENIQLSQIQNYSELNNHLQKMRDQPDPLFSFFNQVYQEINCNFDQIRLEEFPNSSPLLNSSIQINMKPAVNLSSSLGSNAIVPPLVQSLYLNTSSKDILFENIQKPSIQIAQFPQQKPQQIHPMDLCPQIIQKQVEKESSIDFIDPDFIVFDEGYEFEILPPPPVISNLQQREEWSRYIQINYLQELEKAIENKNNLTSFTIPRSYKYTYIGNIEKDRAANCLAEAISCLTELKSFDYEVDALESKGEISARQLAVAISNLKKLTNLNFKFTEAGVNGCLALASAIASCRLLKTLSLSLSFNNISDRGLKELSAAISVDKELTDITLYLSGNDISNTGVLYLISSLATKTYMLESLELYLSCNDFEFKVLKTLALLIRDMTKLKKLQLDIKDNQIEDIDVIELKAIIQQSKSLKVWNVNNSPILQNPSFQL